MTSGDHNRGVWEGEMKQRIASLEYNYKEIQKNLSIIFERLNSIDRKLAAVSPFFRLIEASLIALAAAVVARVL
ncbi:MAG: hypothetical protein ABIH42_03370 [Planctomycetota bacterium]